MLTKRMITLATALTLGLTSAALAKNGGYRVLAEGQAASGGVNPEAHRHLAAPSNPPIMSEGRCFMNIGNGNYGWTDCPRH